MGGQLSPLSRDGAWLEAEAQTSRESRLGQQTPCPSAEQLARHRHTFAPLGFLAYGGMKITSVHFPSLYLLRCLCPCHSGEVTERRPSCLSPFPWGDMTLLQIVRVAAYRETKQGDLRVTQIF